MPYARVGALPQPQNDAQSTQQQGRMGRQQGITMEDLKKQTALRLSQEPSQTELNQRDNEPKVLQIHDLKRQTALRLAQEQEQSRASGQPVDAGMQILPPGQGHMSYYGAQQSFAPVEPHRGMSQDPSRQVFSTQPAENRSFSRYEGQPMSSVNTNVNARTQFAPPNRSNPVVVPNTQLQGVERPVQSQRNPPSKRPESSLSTGSVNSYGSGSTERKGKSKPKLPHGLTVQELKEMTKARLQAEAADGSVEPEPEPSSIAIQQQPYGRGSGEAVSPLSFVQDPTRPVGFQGRISPHTPTPIVTTSLPGDSWQPSSGGMDGWDTASVASTANSEYLGSESAYSSSFHQQDEFSGIPFSRSRSYGAGGYEQPESQGSYFASTSPFDGSIGGSSQNRRRACTLSPRPGPALTYLHEDRPLGNVATNAGLPSFDSTANVHPRIRSINQDTSFSNEPNSQSSSPARFWTASPNGGVIGGVLANRPRTASAPTVRPVSQPSDDFLATGNDQFVQARLPSSHSLRLGGETSTTELSNAFESALGLDGALGLSTRGGRNDGNDDLSSVFRPPSSVTRPPPGLFPTSESSTPGLLSGSRSNDFGLDGWNPPGVVGSRSQEFQTQTRERAHTDGEALLADSLGTMLNVPATRTPSIGQNTFVSRIDPEIDFNRRRAATSSPVSPSHGFQDALSSQSSSLFQNDGAFRDDKPRYM